MVLFLLRLLDRSLNRLSFDGQDIQSPYAWLPFLQGRSPCISSVTVGTASVANMLKISALAAI